jgi:hypothetical protein
MFAGTYIDVPADTINILEQFGENLEIGDETGPTAIC